MNVRTLAIYTGLLSMFLSMAHRASAGQVYGTVARDGRPAGNVTVRVACPDGQAQRNADAHGSYSLYVNATGECQVWVDGAGPAAIRVYPNDVRHDLQLTGNHLSKK